jgi:hypothetical protein
MSVRIIVSKKNNPRSAYTIFFNECERKRLEENEKKEVSDIRSLYLNFKDFPKECSMKWGKMSAEDKKIYIDRETEERKQFELKKRCKK